MLVQDNGWLIDQNVPNKACTGRLGLGVFLELFLPGRTPKGRPQAVGLLLDGWWK